MQQALEGFGAEMALADMFVPIDARVERLE